MRSIFLISIIFFLIIDNIFSQAACYNVNIISPVVGKPTDAIASATCSTFVLLWNEPTSNANDAYIASIMFRDPLDHAQIDTISSPVLWGSLTATFPITPGIVVNWNIQGIKTIDGRTFYSYPLRSSEEYTISDCVSTSVAFAERSTISTNHSLPAAEEKAKAELYPNPVHTILNLNISSIVKNASDNKGIIRVVGVDGKTVLTQKAAFGSVQVNVSRLIIGAYFIRIEDAGGKLLYVAKFIKE